MNCGSAGVGQLYIMHVSGWKKEHAAQAENPTKVPRGTMPLTYSGEMPAGTEYILDMTCMEKYAVRESFCRYGGAAFFNADKEVLGIYVCDLPHLGGELVTEPTKRQAALVLPDDPDSWEFAKFSLRCTLISLLTLRDHLCYCHWIISNRVSIASREQLGQDHPIRRVLKIFTFRSVST
eukprot:COSAG06_NODE_1204_length_10277_cov_21.330517_5_plen_179_part_00